MKVDIIICGLGHIGFRSFELLHLAGKRIAVIIDKAPDDWLVAVNEAGGRVILGDARYGKLLVQAGIHEASAILAVTDQDLVNVAVVMDAKRMNPSIRTICRLFDGNLGAHLSSTFGITQVLSASEIAAPVFLSAVLQGSAIARSSYRGRAFTLENAEPYPATIREGSPSESMAERSIVIARVDAKGVLAAPITEPKSADTNPVGSEPMEPTSDASLLLRTIGRESGYKNRDVFRTLMGWIIPPSLMKFRRVVFGMAIVILAATAVIKVKMGMSGIDALYFVTTTVTTVGYGDFNFSAASPSMKLFGILLMLIGACGIALLFSTLADAFLSERFSNLLESGEFSASFS